MVYGEKLEELKQDYLKKPYCSLGALVAWDRYKTTAIGTGILVSPNLILTAAHNVYHLNNRAQYPNIRFLLGANGKYNLKDFKIVKVCKYLSQHEGNGL
jgi:V8-like Glu-specific endopeptidase